MAGLGLDEALEGIPTPQAVEIPDEGAAPDSSGSVAPETPAPADAEGEGKPVGEDPVGEGEGTPEGEKTQEEILAELTAKAEPQAGDTPVIKELRNLLKTRLDKFQSPAQTEEPVLSDSDREAIEMVQGIFGYDLERDAPTTRPFIDKIVEKDHTLVGQLLMDGINVPVPGSQIQGWTYGHELLKNMGLDPMKFPDLVRFSRGEISGAEYGIQEMPDWVPAEYQEAYKQLDQVRRTDADIYLKSDDPAQKAAALQMLQDKQAVLERVQSDQARQQQESQTFESTVGAEVETQVTQTYSNLLDTVAQNKAFTDIQVHSDPNVDAMVKTTIVNQICALGDDNAVLAKRALDSFQKMGVDVQQEKVQTILNSIKTNTEIAVRAQKRAEREGKRTSPQAEDAKQRVSTAVGQAVSLANRIAGEALKKYSPPGTVKTEHKAGEPNLKGGGTPPAEPKGNGALPPSDLDQLIQQTAKNMRETATT